MRVSTVLVDVGTDARQGGSAPARPGVGVDRGGEATLHPQGPRCVGASTPPTHHDHAFVFLTTTKTSPSAAFMSGEHAAGHGCDVDEALAL